MVLSIVSLGITSRMGTIANGIDTACASVAARVERAFSSSSDPSTPTNPKTPNNSGNPSPGAPPTHPRTRTTGQSQTGNSSHRSWRPNPGTPPDNPGNPRDADQSQYF